MSINPDEDVSATFLNPAATTDGSRPPGIDASVPVTVPQQTQPTQQKDRQDFVASPVQQTGPRTLSITLSRSSATQVQVAPVPKAGPAWARGVDPGQLEVAAKDAAASAFGVDPDVSQLVFFTPQTYAARAAQQGALGTGTPAGAPAPATTTLN